MRRSDLTFRRYFDLGLIGMAITSPTKGIIEVNDELCRIIGYERRELLQKTWFEMTHPEDLPVDVAQFNRVLAGKIDGYSLEKRWIRKDGRVIDSIMSANCERRADGSVDYFVGLVLDITERKRAEKKLRRSEAYLAEGQRLSHTASWAWNVSTGEIFWSQELFRIYGLNPERIKPGYPSVLEYIHPDDRSRAQRIFEEAVREKRGYELAYRVTRPDGGSRYVNNIAHPVFNKAGTLIEYVGTTIDNTERIRAEEKMRRSEGHLAEAQRSGQIGSWTWNVATGECLWSKEHFRMVGIDPETFKPTRENTKGLTHPQDLPFVEQTLERAIREKSEYEMEYRIIRSDGVRYHRCTGRPIERANGELEFIGVVVDLTERKRAEDELQKTQRKLEKMAHVSAMAEIAAAIAHEINQPLGAIMNNSSYCLQLLGKSKAEAKKRAALKDIATDAKRASAIIERIRGVTRGSDREITKLKPEDLIAEVVTLTQRSLEEHHIQLRTSVPNGLPFISCDRVQLQQVLFNLVVNAIEAMSGVQKNARVLTIKAARSAINGSGALLITVADTGSGFEPAAADQMFDAFYTTKPGGMGMGLRISRSIVESCGGQLSARRNKGGGATFSFVLPV